MYTVNIEKYGKLKMLKFNYFVEPPDPAPSNMVYIYPLNKILQI